MLNPTITSSWTLTGPRIEIIDNGAPDGSNLLRIDASGNGDDATMTAVSPTFSLSASTSYTFQAYADLTQLTANQYEYGVLIGWQLLYSSAVTRNFMVIQRAVTQINKVFTITTSGDYQIGITWTDQDYNNQLGFRAFGHMTFYSPNLFETPSYSDYPSDQGNLQYFPDTMLQDMSANSGQSSDTRQTAQSLVSSRLNQTDLVSTNTLYIFNRLQPSILAREQAQPEFTQYVENEVVYSPADAEQIPVPPLSEPLNLDPSQKPES